MLVMLKEQTLPDGAVALVPDRYLRASDFNGKLGQANNPEWKTVAFDETGKVVLPERRDRLPLGPGRPADAGQWNLEAKEARNGTDVKLKLSLLEGEHAEQRDAKVGFPLLRRHRARALSRTAITATCWCARCRYSASRSARRAKSASHWSPPCSTCRPRNTASPRGLEGELRGDRASTTTRPTPRPGRRRSPASRATR